MEEGRWGGTKLWHKISASICLSIFVMRQTTVPKWPFKKKKKKSPSCHDSLNPQGLILSCFLLFFPAVCAPGRSHGVMVRQETLPSLCPDMIPSQFSYTLSGEPIPRGQLDLTQERFTTRSPWQLQPWVPSPQNFSAEVFLSPPTFCLSHPGRQDEQKESLPW